MADRSILFLLKNWNDKYTKKVSGSKQILFFQNKGQVRPWGQKSIIVKQKKKRERL